MAGIRIGQAAGGDSRAFPEKRVICKGFAGTGITGGYPGSGSRAVFGLWVSLSSPFQGMKNIFIWLLILGIVSSLMSHFIEIFDRHQVADLGFYFMYLLFVAILMQCFREAGGNGEGGAGKHDSLYPGC